MTQDIQKIVLSYSGGLDTSLRINAPWKIWDFKGRENLQL